MRSQAVLPVLFACLVLASCVPAPVGGPLATEVQAQGTIFAAAAASAEAFDLTATPLQPLAPTPTPWPTSTPRPTKLVGVLLGADWDPIHPERVTYGIRTDVFVVYVIDEAYDPVRLTLIALPRDLWVEYNGMGPACRGGGVFDDRLNAAWGVWGVATEDFPGIGDPFRCVADVVRWNLGLEVNAPIAYIELRGFVALIDRIGGVTVMPTEDYTDFCGDILGTEGDGGEWRTWRAGRSYSLRGNEALCYVRGRRVAIGDLDRNRRALEVLQAIRDTVFETLPGYTEGLWSFIEFGRDYIELGMGDGGGQTATLAFIVQHLPLALELQDADLRMIRLGTDQTDFWTTPRGASVVLPTVYLQTWLVCVMATDNVKRCTANHPLPAAWDPRQ